MRKNDILELRIERHTPQGQGIAYLPDGMVCFVAGALAGERCRVRLMKITKKLAWGRVEELLEPSKQRVENDCPYYPRCGGCQTRHMSYEAELAVKRQHVCDALERIGGVDISDYDVVISGANSTERYRNKAIFPVGGSVEAPLIGFYRERSHEIVDVEDCLLQHPAASAARRVVRTWMIEEGVAPYQEAEKTGLVRHLLVRTNEAGEALVCLLCNCAQPPKQMQELARRLARALEGFRGLVFGRNMRGDNVIFGDYFETIAGEDFLTETLCGVRYRIGVNSFFQINHAQTQELYALAGAYAQLSGGETILDLYCGIGSIGLSVASRAARLVGVEVVEQAVENARENARENAVEHAQFFCGDAGQIATQFAQEGITPDVIFFDPPRKGLSEESIAAACSMSPKRIVYVSCDPSTLARDIKLLQANGYHLEKTTAVDLFPRTKHVECVCLLTRTEKRKCR